MIDNNTKMDIKSMPFPQLRQFTAEVLGEPAFRADQIFRWLSRGVASFNEMSDLSLSLREKLEAVAYISGVTLVEKQESSDGTVKYLFRLIDGECIEAVVMRYQHGVSLCLSTQAGCAMGCRFCASTVGGKSRNLTAGEMIDQVLFAGKDLGLRITNIVLMGIGEPLDNFENVLAFLAILNDERGLHIGMRHISLSTCGLCDKIEALAKERLGVTLSVSLHAPNDEIRDRLMPVNKKYPIKALLSACDSYFSQTGRRISFEYALFDGVNDSQANADELAHLLRGRPCHVNLIAANTVYGSGFQTSPPGAVQAFLQRLLDRGINATLRRKLGSDIDAACGQLRQRDLR